MSVHIFKKEISTNNLFLQFDRDICYGYEINKWRNHWK